MTAIAAIGGLVSAASSRVLATSRCRGSDDFDVPDADVRDAGSVADGAGLDRLFLRACGRVSAASVGVAGWTRTGAKDGLAEAVAAGGAVDLVGVGRALGDADGVRDGLAEGVLLGPEVVGEGVGVGVALGVADDVGVGVPLGVPDGVAEAVAVGVSVGAADDDGVAEVGVAEDAGVDEPETGAASAGRMTATVEILPAWPDWMLAETSRLRACTAATAAVPAAGEQIRAAPAHAVMAPSTVSVLQPADRWGVADGASGSWWPSPTDIGPPYLDCPGHSI
ncbi:MAG TPA: hypothetical protein VMA72_11705 [Streptosporangiaceae bacterium]|nr:hypothetical protein [Streptosporangiaceae bacterium]